MRSASLVVAAFLLVPLGALSSQQVHVKRGDRIRITATTKGLTNRTARVLAARGDSLFLRLGQAETVGVALAGVTRLQMSDGRSRHTLRGAGLGTLVGVATGAVLGFVSGDDDSGWFALSAQEKAAIYGTTLGAFGLFTGAVVGALTVSESWTSVPLGPTKATPVLRVGPGGARLAVAVSF
jgi:hypothetical protein